VEVAPDELRRLAAALLEHAVHDALEPPARDGERVQAHALDFLLGPRVEPWCEALGLDVVAMRERLRQRLAAAA
jgi:hypothetical protein